MIGASSGGRLWHGARRALGWGILGGATTAVGGGALLSHHHAKVVSQRVASNSNGIYSYPS